MIDDRIHTALMDAYENADLGLATAYEGRRFTPTIDSPHAELFVLPVSSDQRLQTVDKDRGILQVDLFYPQNQGRGELDAKVREVADYFAPHRSFSFEDITFKVVSRERSRVRADAGFMVCSVSVVFEAGIERA